MFRTSNYNEAVRIMIRNFILLGVCGVKLEKFPELSTGQALIFLMNLYYVMDCVII